MTVAVCVKCGAIKHGAFNNCQACGVRPETETDIAYSLVLTDHYFSDDTLNQISTDMKGGKPRPCLPQEQEEKFREAARAYVEKFGEALDLPHPGDPSFLRRQTRFHGVAKTIRPTVVSGLQWRAGFGWMAVVIIAIPSLVAVFTAGSLRVFSGASGLLLVLFTLYRRRRWNKAGWPEVHHRGMLAYAQIAGLEASRAENENREFNKIEACRSLAVAMTYSKRGQASIDAMMDALVREGGGYFAQLVEKYGSEVESRFDTETITLISDKSRTLEFGPQLVIGNIVENTFGGQEATRYVIALVRGKVQ